MNHRKHQKKNNPWIPTLVILLLIILVALELYLLFFQSHSNSISEKNTNETTSETSQSSEPLTKDAQRLENFNQEVKPTSDLAKQINQQLDDNQFIGTALVIQNGQIILQKGFGYGNFAKNQPNTYQSLFQIGSIQKALTAELVLQQVQAQKLSLDETLDRFYPNVQDSQRITIRQLLSMSSGLYQKVKPEFMMTDDAFLQFAISNAQMSTYGQYKYDAINYYLLVGIIEQLTGTSYHTLFNQTFIQRLQLSHTLFYNDFLNSSNRTYAYEKVNGKNYGSEIADKPILFRQEVGTGSVGMTVGDLYLFFSTFLSGNTINKNTFNSLWTPATQDKYMGGFYNYSNYIRGHGVEEGFEPNVYISKDRQNAVILFTNQNPKNGAYTQLGKTIFNRLGSYLN